MVTIAADYSMLFVLAILSAVSIGVVMYRINIKRFMGYPALCDLAVCIFLMDIFRGSFNGMTAAILASLVFSAMITGVRKLVGFERYSFRNRRWITYPGYLTGRKW